MSDKGVCPWCDGEFDVIAYGRKLKCPKCEKPIDVLPEPNVWLETKWGTVGVSCPGGIGELLKVIG